MPRHLNDRHRAGRTGSRDDGLVLPLTLVLTVVLALVATGVATYATGTLRSGNVVQARVDRLAAADGGVRIGLEQLRTRAASCASTASVTIHTGTINAKPVVVSCTRTSLMAADAGMFALVVTGEQVPGTQPTLLAEGTNSAPKMIGGNVYLARPPATLNKPVEISDGDVWFSSRDCEASATPNYGNVTFKPAGERGYICTADTWRTSFPVPALPPKNDVARDPVGSTNSAGCTIFAPGTYNSPPVIGANSQNFFQPGTYSFNFDAPITVKNAVVIGGITRGIGDGSSPVARTPRTFDAPKCASAISAATGSAGPTGVTWVFGGASRLFIDANGQVELFEQQPYPNIIALETAAGGYAAHTYRPATGSSLHVQEGASTGIVAHGRLWAPAGKVTLGNVAGSANAQFMNGVVVGMMDLQSSASAGNFDLRVLTTPATKRVIVTSTADARTTIRAVALVRSGTGEYKIQSWRVQ